MEKQIYRPIGQAESTDERLLTRLNLFSEAHHLSETIEYKTSYKMFCNNVRRSLGINNIIGFVMLNTEEPTITVLIYDVEATNENFYTQKLDENNQPYIEA